MKYLIDDKQLKELINLLANRLTYAQAAPTIAMLHSLKLVEPEKEEAK